MSGVFVLALCIERRRKVRSNGAQFSHTFVLCGGGLSVPCACRLPHPLRHIGRGVPFRMEHWHYRLHSVELRDWISKQGPSVFYVVRAQCLLRPMDIMCAPPRPVQAGICTRVTCSTMVVAGLLSHTANVRSNSTSRRSELWRSCREWLRFALLGLPLAE